MDLNAALTIASFVYNLATTEQPKLLAPTMPKQEKVYVQVYNSKPDAFTIRQSWETRQEHILRLSREGASESLAVATSEEAKRILENLKNGR